jgi:LmbE family N-acetylglucosaminyl deacetylase
MALQGHRVVSLILGEGITSRDQSRNRSSREQEIELLKEQTRAANKCLGIEELFSYDFPDNRFDSVPLLDIIKVIEEVKVKVKPAIVFTHHRGDLNIDHRITCQAVITACRPVRDETVKKIISFEIPSSTEWAAPFSENHFAPNYFVNICETLGAKIDAMACYKNELREYPHPRSLQALRIIAARWGIAVGNDFSEAFQIIRDID